MRALTILTESAIVGGWFSNCRPVLWLLLWEGLLPFALRDHGLRTLVEHLAHFRASLASDYRPQKKSELDQPFSRFPVL